MDIVNRYSRLSHGGADQEVEGRKRIERDELYMGGEANVVMVDFMRGDVRGQGDEKIVVYVQRKRNGMWADGKGITIRFKLQASAQSPSPSQPHPSRACITKCDAGTFWGKWQKRWKGLNQPRCAIARSNS